MKKMQYQTKPQASISICNIIRRIKEYSDDPKNQNYLMIASLAGVLLILLIFYIFSEYRDKEQKLQASKKTISELTEDMNNSSARVRKFAACELGLRKDCSSIECLLQHSTDSNSDVQMAVISALSNIRDYSAVDALVHVLENEEEEYRILKAAEDALLVIAHKNCLPWLVANFYELSWDKQMKVITLIRDFKGYEYVDFLSELLHIDNASKIFSLFSEKPKKIVTAAKYALEVLCTDNTAVVNRLCEYMSYPDFYEDSKIIVSQIIGNHPNDNVVDIFIETLKNSNDTKNNRLYSELAMELASTNHKKGLLYLWETVRSDIHKYKCNYAKEALKICNTYPEIDDLFSAISQHNDLLNVRLLEILRTRRIFTECQPKHERLNKPLNVSYNLKNTYTATSSYKGETIYIALDKKEKTRFVPTNHGIEYYYVYSVIDYFSQPVFSEYFNTSILEGYKLPEFIMINTECHNSVFFDFKGAHEILGRYQTQTYEYVGTVTNIIISVGDTKGFHESESFRNNSAQYDKQIVRFLFLCMFRILKLNANEKELILKKAFYFGVSYGHQNDSCYMDSVRAVAVGFLNDIVQ